MSRVPQRVVYTDGGGRLGNRIIRAAHWLAWAREQQNEVVVTDLALWPYAEYFVGSQRHPGCTWPLPSRVADCLSRFRSRLPGAVKRRVDRRLPNLLHGLGKTLGIARSITADPEGGGRYELDSEDFRQRLGDRRLTFCRGWRFAGWERFARQQTALRAYFQPTEDWIQPARGYTLERRSTCDILVGVLIRRTDYRTWQQGRFHFSDGQYADWMRQVQALHGGRVGFVIASDEAQDPAAFTGLSCVWTTGSVSAGGHWFGSFVELSLCDLIISPPSTFAAAAAF